jgi:hypothetical protein
LGVGEGEGEGHHGSDDPVESQEGEVSGPVMAWTDLFFLGFERSAAGQWARNLEASPRTDFAALVPRILHC